MSLSRTEKILASSLMHHNMDTQDIISTLVFLENEDDQLLMIHYLKTHPETTQQDILNETGRLLKQRKKLNES